MGLSGLEDFRSHIKLSPRALPVTQSASLKRRRSIEGRPQGLVSDLPKKPRFAIPALSKLPSPATSAKIQSAALSVLQSKSATRNNGPVRLRLGLTKRTNIGARLIPNRSTDVSSDLSVKARLSPKTPVESGPSSFVVAGPSDMGDSSGETLALGLSIPDSPFATSRNEKLRIQAPIKTVPTDSPEPSNPFEATPRRKDSPVGRVLVPSSPSPLADRTTYAPGVFGPCDPGSPSSYADVSMLSDGAPELPLSSSYNATLTGLLKKSPEVNDSQAQSPLDGLSCLPSDMLLSRSLSLSLKEPSLSNLLHQEGPDMNTSSYLDTSYDLKSNQLMISVCYDSSQGSNVSQPNQVDTDQNLPVDVFATSSNSESLPWRLSPLENQNDSRFYDDRDLHSPQSSRVVRPMKVSGTPNLDDPDSSGHGLSQDCMAFSPPRPVLIADQTTSSDPRNYHSISGMKSVLYNSSQDSPRLQSQPITLRDQHSQGQEQHPITTDISIPVPSWDSDMHMRFPPNQSLSGARPTDSWEPSPACDRGSPDELVSASHSLSLEDFEFRGFSDDQSREESSVQPTFLAPLGPSARHNSTPTEFNNRGTYNTGLPRGFVVPANKRPGMPKLASYTITEDSPTGTHSPILSFTPLPKRNIPDASLESIESPDISQRITTSKYLLNNPTFRFPPAKLALELEEDISYESQVLQPKINSGPQEIPTPSHATPAPTSDKVTRREEDQPEDDHTPEVPSSIGASAHDEQIPSNVDETENTGDREILQSHEPSLRRGQPRLPIPQLRPLSPPTSMIYKGHLYSVIPQPHFLPSLPCPPPSLTEGMLASLASPSFQNWLSQDGKPAQDQTAAAEKFLSDVWGRAAWIIPVRGRAPWEGCSGAMVSLRPIKDRKKRMIIWTPAALRSLWAQMAGFRDTKRLGSLSMSFEAAPCKPPELEAPKETSELRASHSFEFIKLYHDARVSLKLRTILKVLEFADEDQYGVSADVPKEGDIGTSTTRRLLGTSTRLALLNDTGHIVLIS